jgi:hypothetical protein
MRSCLSLLPQLLESPNVYCGDVFPHQSLGLGEWRTPQALIEMLEEHRRHCGASAMPQAVHCNTTYRQACSRVCPCSQIRGRTPQSWVLISKDTSPTTWGDVVELLLSVVSRHDPQPAGGGVSGTSLARPPGKAADRVDGLRSRRSRMAWAFVREQHGRLWVDFLLIQVMQRV